MVRILGGEVWEFVGCICGKVLMGDRKKRRGKNGLEKGKEGNGIINELFGFNMVCFFLFFNVICVNCLLFVICGVCFYCDKIFLGVEL